MRVVFFRVRSLLRVTWPGQLVAMVLVAAAVGAVVFVGAGAHRTLTLPDRFAAALPLVPDATVEQLDPGAASTATIAGLPSVSEVRSATFVFALLTPTGTKAPVDAALFAGSYEGLSVRLLHGRAPRGVGEIAASTLFLSAAHATVGDTFDLYAIPAKDAEATGFGAGLSERPTSSVRVVGEFAGANELQNDFSVAVIPPDLLTSGIDIGVAATQHAVRLAPGATLKDLRHDLDGLGDRQVFGVEQASAVPPSVEDAIVARGSALLVVTAVLALAVVVALGQLATRQFRIDAVDRVPLRAMGMSDRLLVADPVARAAVPIVLGGALGGVVALALSGRFPLGFVSSIEPSPGFRFDPVVHLAFTAVLMVLLVAWVAGSIVLDDRRRDRPVAASSLDVLARRLSVPSMAVGVHFATSAPRSERSSPVRAAIGPALVVGGVIAALVMGAAADRLVEDRAARSAYDLQIGVGGDTSDQGAIDTLKASPIVSGAAVAGTGLLTVGVNSLDVLALDVQRGRLDPLVLEGHLPRSVGEIDLGRAAARRLGVRPGDALDVSTTSEGEPVSKRLRVGGIVVVPGVDSVDGLGEGGYMTADGLRSLTADATFSSIVVDLADSASPAATKRLAAQLSGGVGSENAVILNVARTRSFLPAIIGALGALGVVSLLHLLIRSIQRRRRELATLRALGATVSWVRTAVRWQVTTMAAVVVLVGLPLGVVVGRSVASWYLDRIGGPPAVPIAVTRLALGVLALVVAVNVLAALPLLGRRGRSVASLASAD